MTRDDFDNISWTELKILRDAFHDVTESEEPVLQREPNSEEPEPGLFPFKPPSSQGRNSGQFFVVLLPSLPGVFIRS